MSRAPALLTSPRSNRWATHGASGGTTEINRDNRCTTAARIQVREIMRGQREQRFLQDLACPIKTRTSIAGRLWQTKVGIREHGRIILAWSNNR